MLSKFQDDDAVGKIWAEKPVIIRAFIESLPQFEKLCDEVSYILKKRMNDSGIEYSAVTSRAKTLKSFAEKLLRKQYDTPLQDVTDLAGVRLVYLYKRDRPIIEDIIESDFDIVEKIDKVEEQETDRFGYGALHYLVHLGRQSSGARYDDLKELICEIQVRTVLQDAWAIIDHHLVYKQESDVPLILRRKLNSLSGLFETADDQFDSVRIARETYKETVKNKLNSEGKFIDQELNLDTLSEFLKVRFPGKPLAEINYHVSLALGWAKEYGYYTLADIDELINRTKKARDMINEKVQTISAAGELVRAIALEKPELRKIAMWRENVLPSLIEAEKLLP